MKIENRTTLGHSSFWHTCFQSEILDHQRAVDAIYYVPSLPDWWVSPKLQIFFKNTQKLPVGQGPVFERPTFDLDDLIIRQPLLCCRFGKPSVSLWQTGASSPNYPRKKHNQHCPEWGSRGTSGRLREEALQSRSEKFPYVNKSVLR